jgi:hypothetical protein
VDEAKETAEARCARDADRLECVIQGIEYRDQGCANARRWIENSRGRNTTKSGQALADAVLDTGYLDWLRAALGEQPNRVQTHCVPPGEDSSRRDACVKAPSQTLRVRARAMCSVLGLSVRDGQGLHGPPFQPPSWDGPKNSISAIATCVLDEVL